MPNHITNRLTLCGPDADEARALLRGKDTPIDFNRLLPMPEALRGDVDHGCVMVAKSEMGVAGRFDFITPRDRRGARHIDDAVVDRLKANIKEYGHAYWLDWAIEKWGTKWGAYDASENDGVIVFDTAWSCPLPFLSELARRFPRLVFTVEFADEDIGSNQGSLTYSGGELKSRTEAHGDTNRKAFAYRIKGYSDADIKEMEEG